MYRIVYYVQNRKVIFHRRKKCSILRRGIFSQCRDRLNVVAYFQACVTDDCAYKGDMDIFIQVGFFRSFTFSDLHFFKVNIVNKYSVPFCLLRSTRHTISPS